MSDSFEVVITLAVKVDTSAWAWDDGFQTYDEAVSDAISGIRSLRDIEDLDGEVYVAESRRISTCEVCSTDVPIGERLCGPCADEAEHERVAEERLDDIRGK